MNEWNHNWIWTNQYAVLRKGKLELVRKSELKANEEHYKHYRVEVEIKGKWFDLHEYAEGKTE